MKNYRITVNGNVYDVTVEETGSVPSAPVAQAAPVTAPKAAPAATPKAATPSGGQGAVKITAPMPGKVLAVKAAVGAAVTKGQVILVLEAMKMENEIVAPQDGTIASIDVAEGAAVEPGMVLASLN